MRFQHACWLWFGRFIDVKNIQIIEGDITRLRVDAIVNAANPGMLGGGGVDGAIHRAAGPTLLEACKKVPPKGGVRCPFGEARITPAGDLSARFVIHTAGPIYANEAHPERVLASSYKNSLLLAQQNQCRSIAFPAISCGAYGYPAKDAAIIALQTCADQAFADIDIVFCLMGSDMKDIWLAVYRKLASEKPCD